MLHIPHKMEDLIPIDDLNMNMKVVLKYDTGQFSSDIYSTCDKETNTSPFLLSQEARRPTTEKASSVPPKIILKTTQMIHRIEVKSLKKKIKVLEEELRKKDKKILIMKNILDKLNVDYISECED